MYLEQELMDGGKRSFTLWELGPKPLHRTRVIGSFHFIVSFFFFPLNSILKSSSVDLSHRDKLDFYYLCREDKVIYLILHPRLS